MATSQPKKQPSQAASGPTGRKRRAGPRRTPGRPKGDARTRERILEAAIAEFAASGFSGSTVRTVAEAVGVSTASLLHHFPSKERLYGAVLARIAESLEDWGKLHESNGDAVDEIVAMVEDFFAWTERHDVYSRILLRELMDNASRATSARHWYLAPVVRRCTQAVDEARKRGNVAAIDAEIFVFQFVGSVVYFFVALPTALRIFDATERDALVVRFRTQLLESTRRALTLSGDEQ